MISLVIKLLYINQILNKNKKKSYINMQLHEIQMLYFSFFYFYSNNGFQFSSAVESQFKFLCSPC